MSKLQYRTVADMHPQGKPYVYFSCHPEDFEKYFEEYALKIMRIEDCAIWYESEPEGGFDREDLALDLNQMQLFVMPVTGKLLTTPNRAMDVEFPIAQEKHIPVLPLMMERGLDHAFSERFGNLHYLVPDDKDKTRRSFDEVLEKYIKSILVSSDLAERVRAAFDAYIFLSYRKKDRKKAQELMRLIHRNPLCRNIAIWYDEFLIPGEDFNQAIGEMLKKSNLFTLVVTPNLVNEVNYVMTTEYPAAIEQEKPVLPVEMVETDRSRLEEQYEGLPPCVRGEENEVFRNALIEKIREIAVSSNDKNPEHNFLIGLAYLNGIDVEVDPERALELITGAAEAEVPEAISHLIMMYENGKGTERDFRKAIYWREKEAAMLRKKYESEPDPDNARELTDKLSRLAEKYTASGNKKFLRILFVSYDKLGNVAKAERKLAEAQEYYKKSHAISETLVKENGTVESRRDMTLSYSKLGDIAKARGNLADAQKYYKKCLAVCEELAKDPGTVEIRQELSIIYDMLGDTEMAKGNLSGAQEYYKKCIAINEGLAEEIQAPQTFQILYNSYSRMGDIAKEQGNLAEAWQYYKRYHIICKALADDIGTVRMIRDLSVSYNKLGEVEETRGNFAGAQEYYKKGLSISKELAEKTGTVESREDLAVSYITLGDAARERGDLIEAEKNYEKALEIREALANETDLLLAYRHFAASLFYSGVFYYTSLHNLVKAKEMFERVLELAKGSSDAYLAELGKKAEQVLDQNF